MGKTALIVGGGIGGMAAALALGRSGWEVQLFEQASEFSEVGAGIQMGPNVTRVLQHWGLTGALRSVGAFPERLQVRSADSGRELGVLTLGQRAVTQYGAPYATIHRADLLGLLHEAVQQQTSAVLQTGCTAGEFSQSEAKASLAPHDGTPECAEGDLLVGADGLWSLVRQWLLSDGSPRVTSHVAYRALTRQSGLPLALRSQQISVWLGPGLHVVQYPVRGGDWLNVVVIVQQAESGAAIDPKNWDHHTTGAALRTALAGQCAALQDLVEAIGDWRLWTLCDRIPMVGSHQHARGRVALVGDAAHPMRPYLAQGAGMAIEDAAELERVLTVRSQGEDVPAALRRFAQARWQRNARVQERSTRNGQIFHAHGALRWARDTAMRLVGERLLDLPWLYSDPEK